MAGKLAVINGQNLQQAVKQVNQLGIQKEDIISILNMPNSSEFNIVYWTHE